MADSKQLLHLVFGGELTDPQSTEFVDTDGLDLVGIYPDYQSALVAWRGKAQSGGATRTSFGIAPARWTIGK